MTTTTHYKYIFHGWLDVRRASRDADLRRHARTCWSNRTAHEDAVIMSEDAAWTTPLDAEYQKCLPKAGLKVLDHIRFNPDTTDFTPIFHKIEGKASGRHRHRHQPCGRAADRAVARPAGADPDGRPELAGHHQQFWKDTNGATEGVITSTAAAPGVALTPDDDPVHRRLYQAFRRLAVL